MNETELLQELLRCKSVTPHDDGALDVLAEALKSIGFSVQFYEFADNNLPKIRNLYAKYGKGPSLAFAGHTDVVPAVNEELWVHPPFMGVIDAKGDIYGRGAVDMKGAIAAFYGAAKLYIEEGGEGALSFIITGDEEGDGINGTKRLMAELENHGETFRQAIVGEPTNPVAIGDMIKIGRRGSASFKLLVEGKEGHVAYPQLADNPITKLIELLNSLKDIVIDEGNEFFEASNLEIVRLVVDNDAMNVIPKYAEAYFNVRFNNNFSSESLYKFIANYLNKHEIKHELMMLKGGSESFLTVPNKAVTIFQEVVSSVVGKIPLLTTDGGTSDARFIKDYCPVFEFGLINSTAHKIDERTCLSDIELLKKIYYGFIVRFYQL